MNHPNNKRRRPVVKYLRLFGQLVRNRLVLTALGVFGFVVFLSANNTSLSSYSGTTTTAVDTLLALDYHANVTTVEVTPPKQEKQIYPAWNEKVNQPEIRAMGNGKMESIKTDDRKKEVIWSRARKDRSGATIQDMLMCHAYAVQHDLEYGGACPIDWNTIKDKERMKKHQSLLEAVGLHRLLRLACPATNRSSLMNRYNYIRNDTAIFQPTYLEYMHQQVDYPPKDNKHLHVIAVHIRRGDIKPCRPLTRGYPRYLPNQHYLRLIDRYNQNNNSHVVIYSEANSFESFDVFRQRGYQVELGSNETDDDIGQVWKGFMASDILILSRSSFSLVPAILHRGIVVYTPFWHEPLPHWHVVDDTTLNDSLNEFERLKRDYCPTKKKKKKKRKANQPG